MDIGTIEESWASHIQGGSAEKCDMAHWEMEGEVRPQKEGGGRIWNVIL